jgi:hypothetical protein
MNPVLFENSAPSHGEMPGASELSLSGIWMIE